MVLLFVVVDPHLRTTVPAEPAISSHYITLVAPITRPVIISAPSKAPVLPEIARLERPKIAPPATHVEPPPKPQKIEVAKTQPVPETLAPPAKPAASAPVKVKANAFDSQASNLPVVQNSPRKVQTGGFGDPNGLPGQGDPKRETITATNVGAFDLPAGQGKGNGTGESHGISNKIRTAGFGAASAQPVMEARNQNVAAGAFGDVVAETRTPDAQPVAAKPHIQPVQILFKPRPTYTPEARRVGVQGEVLLDVVFQASGSLHINRVVKSLGYGLDDMALEAAKKIQFRPALRDGQPYDYAALVHIRFELAE